MIYTILHDAVVERNTLYGKYGYKWHATVTIYKICPIKNAVTSSDSITVFREGDTKVDAVNSVFLAATRQINNLRR